MKLAAAERACGPLRSRPRTVPTRLALALDGLHWIAYTAYMKRRQIQYTVRSVPAHVDRALRRRARTTGTSLNEVLIHSLEAACHPNDADNVRHDLDWISDTWVEDERTAEALEVQRVIDADLWT